MFVRGSSFRQKPRYRRRENLKASTTIISNLLYRFILRKEFFVFFTSILSIVYRIFNMYIYPINSSVYWCCRYKFFL